MDLSQPRGLVLNPDTDPQRLELIFKALGSTPRIRILRLLADRLLNVSEVAHELDIPVSTANVHINILTKAGLLLSEHRPATRGSQKVCTRAFDSLHIQLPRDTSSDAQVVEHIMPVGAYVDCQVTPTCGLASETGIIGLFDDPASFYETNRVQAQLLWFHQGYVEYRFPKRLPPNAALETLSLSFEACSEAPLHHEQWPSDITVWLNGTEVATWTSPADFGGRRGKLTPSWWEEHSTQHGLLKVWQVNREASFVDGLKASDVTLADLELDKRDFVSVRIGVKPDTRHVGGINVFGRAFGNYPQDIVLRFRYR
jgi:predicted transcriptional regulator